MPPIARPIHLNFSTINQILAVLYNTRNEMRLQEQKNHHGCIDASCKHCDYETGFKFSTMESLIGELEDVKYSGVIKSLKSRDKYYKGVT